MTNLKYIIAVSAILLCICSNSVALTQPEDTVSATAKPADTPKKPSLHELAGEIVEVHDTVDDAIDNIEADLKDAESVSETFRDETEISILKKELESAKQLKADMDKENENTKTSPKARPKQSPKTSPKTGDDKVSGNDNDQSFKDWKNEPLDTRPCRNC